MTQQKHQLADINTRLLKVIVDRQNSTTEVASALFLISASYYENYNMDDPATFTTMSRYANIYLRNEIRQSILSGGAPEKLRDNLVYWLDVMDRLHQKGDYNSAVIIRLVVDELEFSKKNDSLQKAFAILPPNAKKMMDFKADKNLKNLSYYNDKTVTIPYLELFSFKQAIAEEAKSEKAKREIEDLKALDQQVKTKTKVQVSQEIEKLSSLIQTLERYQEKHKTSENSSNEKVIRTTALLNCLQDESLSYKQKAEALKNVINEAHSLKHTNPINSLMGKDFTLIKLARDILPLVQALEIRAGINTSVPTIAVQANEKPAPTQETSISDQPSPPTNQAAWAHAKPQMDKRALEEVNFMKKLELGHARVNHFADVHQQIQQKEKNDTKVEQVQSVISPPNLAVQIPSVIPPVEKPAKPDFSIVLNNLIASYTATDIQGFQHTCQHLIDQHGLLAFKNTVDEMLIDKTVIKKIQRDDNFASALKVLNQQLINATAATFSSVMLESAKKVAQTILDLANKPPEYFHEEAQKLALQAISNEKENAQKNAAHTIKEVNEREDTVENKETAIAHINNGLEEKLADIEQKPRPIDYYVEKARLANISKYKYFTQDASQSFDLACAVIRKDILSSTSLEKRTLIMERYILTAEKLLAENQVDAANVIVAALQKGDISRLEVTQGGLSTYAQNAFKNMCELFTPMDNFAAMRHYIAANSGAYLPIQPLISDIDHIPEEIITSDEHRHTQPIKNNKIFAKILENCQKIHTATASGMRNNALAQEINKDKQDVSALPMEQFDAFISAHNRRQNALDRDLYKLSREKEPKNKNKPLKSSAIMSDIEHVLHPTLPQKIRETLDTEYKKIDHWATTQHADTEGHLSISTVEALKEALNNESNFTANIQQLKNLVILLKQEKGLTSKEKDILNNYLHKIDNLINSTKEFWAPIRNSINGSEPSPEELIEKLHTQYASPNFRNIMDQLTSLIGENQVKVDNIHSKYTAKNPQMLTSAAYIDAATSMSDKSGTWQNVTLNFNAFSFLPTQRLTRVVKPLEAIHDALRKESGYVSLPENERSNHPLQKLINLNQESINTINKETHRSNDEQAAREIRQATQAQFAQLKSRGKQTGVLKQILNLNLNTKLQNNSLIEVGRFPAYLQESLLLAYPETFKRTANGEFVAVEEKAAPIYVALGLDAQKTGATLEPSNFNGKELDNLYRKDQNPLWLVLKSTKPIDEHFSAEEKIQTYVALAKAYKNQEIGKKNKYQGAYKMLAAALAVSDQETNEANKEHLSAYIVNTFNANSELGAWINSKVKKNATRKEAYPLISYIENLSKTIKPSVERAEKIDTSPLPQSFDVVTSPLEEVHQQEEQDETNIPEPPFDEVETTLNTKHIVYKPESVVTYLLERNKMNAEAIRSTSNELSVTSKKGEQFILEERPQANQVRCFDVTHHTTHEKTGVPIKVQGRFIYEKSDTNTLSSTANNQRDNKTNPGKYIIHKFPTKTDGVSDADLEAARVNFAMTVATQVLANMKAPPSKEKPIRLQNGSAEELKYLWTAFAILGEKIPQMKFSANAIHVASYKFDAAQEKGFFGYSSNSLYKTAFKTHHSEVNDYVNMAKEQAAEKLDDKGAKESVNHFRDLKNGLHDIKQQSTTLEKDEESDSTSDTAHLG